MSRAEEYFEEQLEMNVIHVHDEKELQRMFKFAESFLKHEVNSISDLLDKRIKITNDEKENENDVCHKSAKGGKIRAYKEIKDWMENI